MFGDRRTSVASVPAIPNPGQVQDRTRTVVNETYGKLPLYFEANLGQADHEVKFLARTPSQTLE